jgi:hypothetical protein
MATKIVKVKASKRKGKIVKAHTRVVHPVTQSFISAVGKKKVVAYRLHFELPDGRIGITPAYSNKESIEAIRKEAEATGAKFLKKVKDNGK